MRIQTFGTLSGVILSIGAGALTQSTEYSFLALPVAIGAGLVWLMILGVFVYRNRFAISGWIKKVGPAHLMMLVGLGGIIVFAAIALGGIIWQSQDTQAAVLPSKPASQSTTEYLQNATLIVGADESQMPLALGGTSTITTDRLRVFVDYAHHRSGWMSRVRAPIGEIKDPVKGQYVRVELIYRGTRTNGGTNQLWWGDNANFHPVNGPDSNPIWPVVATRGRVVIIGPSGDEQYIYFELMRADPIPGKQEFSLFQKGDVGDWLAKWEADK
jgi:hypothetical protein